MLTSLLLPAALLSPPALAAERFLMVGNSYTANNDLHRLTFALLEEGQPDDWAGGVGARLTDADMSFVVHVDRSKVEGSPWYDALRSGEQDWEWILLQEQGQIPGFPQDNEIFLDSVKAARGLDDLVQARGAETVLLMTWGWRAGDEDNPTLYPDFSTMQGRLVEGYRRYQEDTSTEARPTWVAPVGVAFARIHDEIVDAGEDPLGEGTLFRLLYITDGAHPSTAGSYLAACVVYATLTGEDPVGLSAPDTIDPVTKEALQEAAAYAVFEADIGLTFPWMQGSDSGDSGTDDSGSADSPADGGGDGSGGSSGDGGGCGGRAALWVLGLGGVVGGWRRRGRRGQK